jgi:tetratricopeptide (TPR) repeat protein
VQIIGIDFGASRLRVAIEQDGRPALVHHALADKPPPSILQPANAGLSGVPAGCRIIPLKRLMDFDTSLPVSAAGMNSMEYLSDGLSRIRGDCAVLGAGDDSHCVMAVPPCFSQRQRSALRSATEQAGFPRVRLVDDTLAALLDARPALADARTVLVYAWGASAFSAGVFQQRGSGYVPVTAEGDRDLGGDDIDSHVAGLLADALLALDLNIWLADRAAQRAVVDQARAARATLVAGQNASFRIGRIMGGAAPSALQDQTVTVKGAACEAFIAAMVGRTFTLMETALRDAQCTRPDAILLVGGMTALPSVRKGFKDRFDVEPVVADEGAVARGAVLQGRMISAEEWKKAERPPPPPRPDPAPATDPRAGSPDPARPTPPPAAGGWASIFIPFLNDAEQHERDGRWAETIDSFEKLFDELGRFSGQMYRRVARILMDASRTDDALRVLRAAHLRAPQDRPIALDLVDLCITRGEDALARRQPHEAVALADVAAAALRGLPDKPDAHPRRLARVLYVRAVGLCNQGHLAEAVEILDVCRRYDDHPNYARTQDEIRTALKRSPERRSPAAKVAPARVAPGKAAPGRNDLCPCGSGEKYKKCCGRNK